jgi:hypothetical protein
MGLTLADIDRWDPGAIHQVAVAADARARGSLDASDFPADRAGATAVGGRHRRGGR